MRFDQDQKKQSVATRVEVCDAAVGMEVWMEGMGGIHNFKGLVEKSADSIIVLDGERCLLYANAQVKELSGYDDGELVNSNGRGIFNIGTLERICSVCRLAAGNDTHTTCFDSFMMTKSFGDIPVEVNAFSAPWEGRPAAVAFIRGLSRRKALEESYRQVMLKQANKITALSEELEKNARDLGELRRIRDMLSREVLETNEAVAVLARNVEKRRKEEEKMIGRRLSSRIMPVVMEIKNGEVGDRFQPQLDVLENYLKDLSSTLVAGSDPLEELSAAEMRVASMIRNGAKTDEIAGELGISSHTVKTHRKNIRKKINLRNSKVNLTAYLRSKM